MQGPRTCESYAPISPEVRVRTWPFFFGRAPTHGTGSENAAWEQYPPVPTICRFGGTMGASIEDV